MENQQNRWHSSIVTSYSPEWFLVKDLCTWYKSEAHSCRPNHGLFTLIKFGIAALPLRTWRHYHFLHWCFLSCIHLNISKILIKMVIKLWTKDIRYVFGRREKNINNNKKQMGKNYYRMELLCVAFRFNINFHGFFSAFAKRAITVSILWISCHHSEDFVSSIFLLTHSHSHCLSQWNMKIILPAKQKKIVFVLFHLRFILVSFSFVLSLSVWYSSSSSVCLLGFRFCCCCCCCCAYLCINCCVARVCQWCRMRKWKI